jgi:hypothetical protein
LTTSISVSVALTGVSVVVNNGLLGIESAGNVTVQLTGTSLAVNSGALTSSAGVSTALAGSAVVVNAGAIGSSSELVVALAGKTLSASSGALSTGFAYELTGVTIPVRSGALGVQAQINVTTALTGVNVVVHSGNFVLFVPTIQALKYPLFVRTREEDLVVID